MILLSVARVLGSSLRSEINADTTFYTRWAYILHLLIRHSSFLLLNINVLVACVFRFWKLFVTTELPRTCHCDVCYCYFKFHFHQSSPLAWWILDQGSPEWSQLVDWSKWNCRLIILFLFSCFYYRINAQPLLLVNVTEQL